jgi:GntR family transcriptional regulator / MocR family aminotransferase
MARKKLQAKMSGGRGGGLAALRFDRRSAVPLYRQVYDRLRDIMASGAFGPGARLPSSRSLASQLSLSRATVAYAYDLLAGDGYIGGRGQAGTYVAPGAVPAPRGRPRTRPSEAAWLPKPLQVGVPALEAFPRKLWSRLEKRHAASLTIGELAGPEACGFSGLRTAMANRLAITRGIACDPEQIFITAGFQGALMLAGAAILKRGDAVVVEDPGYAKAWDTLGSLNARLIPAAVDVEGLRVATALKHAAGARMAVVTPCHQFPLGGTLAAERRAALLDWAREHDAWIVEDDNDNDFHFAGQPALPMKSADVHDRVLYVSSFGKLLFPGLRISCLVVPRLLVADFTRIAGILPVQPATREQAVLADFIRRGFIGRHINRMRRLYAQRRGDLLAALESAGLRNDAAIKLEVPAGGLHLIAWLERGASDAATAARAEKEGLGVLALSSCAIRPHRPALLLGYGATESADFPACARRLLRALN